MDNKYTGADLFVDALEKYGIKHVFGNPGTTELPVIHALSDSSIEYVLGLHEDIAVGMAGGYSSTRRYHYHQDESINPLSVVNLHASAGLAHGLGNLYAAEKAGCPMLLTAGIHSTDFQHEEPILYEDLSRMTEPFTKWSAEVKDVSALPTMIRRAARVALTPPMGPVFLSFPVDVMMQETQQKPERLGSMPALGPASESSIEETTTHLVNAEEPIIVVGDQIARAGTEAIDKVIQLSEISGARVHGEVLSCEVNFPTDHPHWVSYLPPQEDLLRSLLESDLIFFIGCTTQTTLTRHENDLVQESTTCIHLGEDAWHLGKNEPADVTLIGDISKTLTSLNSKVSSSIEQNTVDERKERIPPLKELVEAKISELAETQSSDDRMSKVELVNAMYQECPDAYIVDEGVTSKYAMLTNWPLQKEQYLSNKGGGLGYGLPASVGAALAEKMRPDPRNVVGFVGDGSYLYYPHSIYSAFRLDLDLTVVISDNRNYRILKDNTLELLGGEESDYEFIGMNMDPSVNLELNAESHGARGHTVNDADSFKKIYQEELTKDGVGVIDALVHD